MAVQGDRTIGGHLHTAHLGTSFARAYAIPSNHHVAVPAHEQIVFERFPDEYAPGGRGVTTTPESRSSNWPPLWLLIHQPPTDGYPIMESRIPLRPHTSMRPRRNGGPHARIPVGADVTGPASVAALAACFRGAA
jgi:hypothetical protein